MDIRLSRRLLSSVCPSCRTYWLPSIPRRRLTTSGVRQEETDNDFTAFARALRSNRRIQQKNPANIRSESKDGPNPSQMLTDLASVVEQGAASRPAISTAAPDTHHLHVYSHRHNTHITLTRPNREPILSMSAGQIGFRHASRGTFDAAYRLTSIVITKMHERGLVLPIEKLEIIMRGYGPGREAFQKALLGAEGRTLKPLITRVTDSTRLKFGGTRSKNVRRL